LLPLLQEEAEILSPEMMEAWEKADPAKAAKDKEEVLGYLADIRKLRSRRHKAALQYRLLTDPIAAAEHQRQIAKVMESMLEDMVDEEEKDATKADEAKRKLELLKLKIKRARETNIEELAKIEEEMTILEEYIENFMSSAVEAYDRLDKASESGAETIEINGETVTIGHAQELVDRIEKETKIAEEMLAKLAKDREAVQEILAILNEFTKEMPTDTDAYMYDKIQTVGALSEFFDLISMRDTGGPGSSTATILEDLWGVLNSHNDQLDRLKLVEQGLSEKLKEMYQYRAGLQEIIDDSKTEHGTELPKTSKEWLNKELLITEERIRKMKESWKQMKQDKISVKQSIALAEILRDDYLHLAAMRQVIEASEKKQKGKAAKGKNRKAVDPEEEEDNEREEGKSSKKKGEDKGTPNLKLPDLLTGLGKTVSRVTWPWYGEKEGARETYQRLKNIPVRDQEGENNEEKLFRIAESQLRFNHYLNSHSTSGLSIVLVHKNNIPKGADGAQTHPLEELSTLFHTVEEGQNDIKAVLIKKVWKDKPKKGKNGRVILDKNKKPVTVKRASFQFVRVNKEGKDDSDGNLVFASIPEPTFWKTSEGDKGYARYTNRTNLDVELEIKKYKAFRDRVLEDKDEQHVFYITGKQQGTLVQDAEPDQNHGRIVKKKNEYKNVLLEIGEAPTQAKQKDEVDENNKRVDGRFKNRTQISKSSKMPSVMSRLGIVWAYDQVRAVWYNMYRRKLNDRESVNVSRMMHRLLVEREKAYDKLEGEEKTWENAWRDVRSNATITVVDKKTSAVFEQNLHEALKQTIQISASARAYPIVYAARTKENQRDYGFKFKLKDESGDFVTTFVGLKEFEEGGPEIEELLKFLKNKYHQVDKNAIKNSVNRRESTYKKRDGTSGTAYLDKWEANSDATWGEIRLNEKLEPEASRVWANYNEYLLMDREEEGELSPLMSKVKPIDTNEVLDAGRIDGGYWQFKADIEQSITLAELEKDPSRKRTAGTKERRNNWGPKALDKEEEDLDAEESKLKPEPEEPAEGMTDDEKPPSSDAELLAAMKKSEHMTPDSPGAEVITAENARAMFASAKAIDEDEEEDDSEDDESGEDGDLVAMAAKKAAEDKAAETEGSVMDSVNDMLSEDDAEEDVDEDANMLDTAGELDDRYEKESYKEQKARVLLMRKLHIGKRTPGYLNSLGAKSVAKLASFGKVLISRLAPGGALYHEGFHDVSMYILSPKDAKRLYNLVRRTKGKTTTYKGESKNMSDLTDKEADEWLAEEFRRYVLFKGEYVIGQDTVQEVDRNLIQRFFDWIKDIYMSLGSFGYDRDSSTIEDLFQSIKEGQFREVEEQHPNREKGVEAAMLASTVLSNTSTRFSHDLMYSFTAYVAKNLDKELVWTDKNGQVKKKTFKFEDLLQYTEDEEHNIPEVMVAAYEAAYLEMRKHMIRLMGHAVKEGDKKKLRSLRDAAVRLFPTLEKKTKDEEIDRKLEIFQIHKNFMNLLGFSVERSVYGTVI